MENNKGVHLDASTIEALKLRAQRLREQREARQTARLQLLKSMHLQKVPTESIFLSSQSKNKPIDLTKSRKSIMPKVDSVKSQPGDISLLSKNEQLDSKNTFNNVLAKSRRIEYASKSRQSIFPKPEAIKPKVTQKAPIVSTTVPVKTVDKRVNLAATSERLSKPKTFAKPNVASLNKSLPNKAISNRNVNEKINNSCTNYNVSKTTKFVPRKSVAPPRKSVAPPRKSMAPVVSKPHVKNDILNNDKVKFEEAKKLRRSLSTVHFKRLGENAVKDCFKRTLSLGNIKNKEIEDELPEFPPKNYVLSVGSEKKKSVTFFTPMRKSSTPNMCLNTPKPSELRKRLNDWLQKRGKSLSTFHHLKCFGLKHHEPLSVIPDALNDEENKENVEINDDDSFKENFVGEVNNKATGWRQRTTSDSSDLTLSSPTKTPNGNILQEFTPRDKSQKIIEPLISDALYDLNQLIVEEYSWLQCAEWLRAIVRECGENVKDIPAYWECRAALEEKRGDFVRTVDCFNNALQRGAQPKNVEESLDKLLNKFMKLNLDPTTDTENVKHTTKNLLDVKNVFKSFLIKFAIRQAEECVDGSNIKKKYTATPVRRSSRIPHISDKSQLHTKKFSPQVNLEKTNGHVIKIKTPDVQIKSTTKIQPPSARKHLVQLCDSLRNVDDDIKQTLVFVPNKALNFNDCM